MMWFLVKIQCERWRMEHKQSMVLDMYHTTMHSTGSMNMFLVDIL